VKRTILFLVACLVTGTAALADDMQYDIRVDGITCPFCVATSERALKKIEGVHSVGSNLETGTIFVCADSQGAFTDAQLQQLFLDKGFTYRSFTKASGCSIAGHEHEDEELRDIPEDHADHSDTKSLGKTRD
jgi:mercuric ion binding protein